MNDGSTPGDMSDAYEIGSDRNEEYKKTVRFQDEDEKGSNIKVD
jgi:hypothetical protein